MICRLPFVAAKYKQMLLETGCGEPGPNEEKMILVFKVLDQILPHLGVFVEVMKLCRDEIFGKMQELPDNYITLTLAY